MRRLAAMFLFLPIVGCATVAGVERHAVPANAEQVLPAVVEAASRLHWTKGESTALKPGQLQFVALPDRLLVSVEGNELVLEGPSRWKETVNGEEKHYPGYMAQLLEQATDQVLVPASAPAEAHIVSAKIPGLAVALDLVEPALGAAYAVPGDPFMEGDGYGWVGIIAIRGLVDVAGAGAVVYGETRNPVSIAPVVAGVVLLAASRILFSAIDWFLTQRRNQVSASGFRFALVPR